MSQNVEQNLENLQPSQEKIKDLNTLFEIERNAYQAILQTSPIFNKYSSWLLVGCGAAASLVIAHMDTINNYLSLDTIQLSLLILVIAGLFGLLEKHIALNVETNLSIIQNLWPIITTIVSEHIKHIDETSNTLAESTQKGNVKTNLSDITNKFKNQFKKVAPSYSRYTIDKYYKKSKADPLYVHKISIKLYNRQKAYFFLASLSFFSFIILIAFSLK